MHCKQIAIYGKGGIGKSTVSSNLAVAMAKQGQRVMLIGCDPKQDSTLTLSGGHMLPSVLEQLHRLGEAGLRLEDCCFEGEAGTIIVESGGPEPGVGCAGRGVITALEILDRLDAWRHYDIDVILYDVLGDVVCGGFAMPLRAGYASEIYLVTSGELMALYAANNICKAIKRLVSPKNPIGLGGIILNGRDVESEHDKVEQLAVRIGAPVVAKLPRDPIVQTCEARKQTVITGAPDSEIGRHILRLAERVTGNDKLVIPEPLTRQQLTDMLAAYQ